MAKRKRQPSEPIIHPGVPLPLDYPEIPQEWMPTDDFSSHRPMLYRAIMNTAHTAFFEFGMGDGSTPLLRELYNNDGFRDKDYVSYENNLEWFQKYLTPEYSVDEALQTGNYWNHFMSYQQNLMAVNTWKGSIVFIDCAPGELRKHLISKHCTSAKLIIVHDTEPGAEYVYGMNDILNTFKFRCDLIVDGNPQTTIVSNLYEFNTWKTLVNENIRFI
jgi:hypothetical protein